MRLATMLAATAWVGLFAGTALAEDKLILKDGQEVKGDILSEGAENVEIKSGEETIRVPTWAIEKIERDGPNPAPATSAGRTAPAAEASPAMKAWVDTCVEHLASKDDDVRRGAKAALRSAGPAATPALQKASTSADKTVATAATQLLAQIDQTARKAEGVAPEVAMERAQDRKTQAMTRSLGLDEKQKPQFEKIMGDLHASQREVTDKLRDNQLTGDQAREKITGLHAETRKKLESVLTQEQLKKYDEQTPGRREDAKQPKAETPAG